MDGYITGNGYMVTWALGHLVSLALPGTYGYTPLVAKIAFLISFFLLIADYHKGNHIVF